MKLFSFDSYWGLDWQKGNDGYHTFRNVDLIYQVDASITRAPRFAIYKGSITKDNCLVGNMDSDSFIMQIKSLRETGKIVVKSMQS